MVKKFIYQHWYFLIGLILTLSLIWPLFAAPYFYHQDNAQHIRIYEMDQCIKDGQIPCRWVPDLGGGYGYPLFNYYAPLPYYIGEIFYLITGDILVAAKFIFALPLILSFIFMYKFASKLWGPLGGSISAIFYSFVPYHALDMYVRGDVEELWALAFFPAIFWALWKLKDKTNLANGLLLGLMMALLILSHNLSTMIFIPIVLIVMLLIVVKSKNFNFLKFVVMSLVLAVALSAFYLLPVLWEKNLIHTETLTEGYFSYTEHFKGLKKLFIDRDWLYGDSIREVPGGEKDGLSYQIGWAHLLGLLLALLTAYIYWNKDRRVSWTILFFTTVTAISIFMIHPHSELIWKLIDPLKYLQFPWRFLILISFFISVLGGCIFLIVPKKQQPIIWYILALLVVTLNFSYFRPQYFLNLTQAQVLSLNSLNKLKMYAIFDYLPKSAEAPPAQPASNYYEILTGETEVMDLNKGSDWLTFKTLTRSHTIIRVNQYYFPTWVIKVDGNPVVFDYKNSLGLMNVLLGEGRHNINIRLHDTPIRSVGNYITVVAILIFITLSLYVYEPGRQHLKYYLKAFKG